MNVSTAVKIKTFVDSLLGQSAKLRRGGCQAVYFCKCGHYKRKLEFSLETFVFHCWVCGWSGNIYTLFKEYNAPQNYYDETRNLLGDDQKFYFKRKPVDKFLSLPPEFISLAEPSNDPAYKNAIFYLKKRNVGIEDICRYNIGYCNRGEYKDCIIIPSYDAEGKLNYFSSRYFYYNYIKYKNAPFSKNVVGFESFINYDEPVTLVEGVFDGLAVRKNAVPLFGTTLSNKLREALVINKTPRVNLVLDNDAMKYAIRIAQNLWKLGICVHLVQLPGKDPSELGFEKVHDLIEESTPLDFRELIYQRLME